MISTSSHLVVVNALETVIAALREQLAQTQERLAQTEAKLDRLEILVVPGFAPRSKPRDPQTAPVSVLSEPVSNPDAAATWYGPDGYLNRWMKQQELLEKAAKEKANGIQDEGRPSIHKQASGPVA